MSEYNYPADAMPPPRRLGKQPAVSDPRVPRLSAVLREDELPEACNWIAAVDDWPMLANDHLGDCVVAAALHCEAQRLEYAGHPVEYTDADAIALYSAWGGYVPGEPATDQGTYMTTALAKWAADGNPSQLVAYAAVNHVSSLWLRRAIWRCGGVLVGLQCPEAWLSADYLLDLPDGLGAVAGGHAVYLAGFEPTALGIEYDCITWGARFRVTERALLAVADEAFALLSRDWCGEDGRNPAGVAWDVAEAAMADIRRA